MSDLRLLALLYPGHELSRLLSCSVHTPSTHSCEMQKTVEAYN